jgi:hypothetical protein
MLYLRIFTLVRFVAAVALCCTALAVLKRRNLAAKKFEEMLKWGAVLAGGFVIAAYAALAVASLHSFLLDTDEANILAVSAAAFRQPLYEPLVGASAYHPLLYGPLCFFTYHAVFSVLSTSVLALRVVCIAPTLLALWLIYAACRRFTDRSTAVALLAFPVCLLIQSDTAALGARSDGWALLLISLATWLAVRRPALYAPVVCGLLIGTAMGFKLTVAPAALLTLLLLRRNASRVQQALAMLAVIAAASWPFLLASVSLRNYLDWLRVTARAGVGRDYLLFSIAQGALLLAAVVAAYRFTTVDSSARGRYRLELCALAVALLLTAWTGGKGGSGAWYFFPFFPYVTVLCASVLGRPVCASGRSHLVPWLLATASFLVTLSYLQKAAIGISWKHHSELQQIAQQMQEIRTIIAAQQGTDVEIGYGRSATAVPSLLRYVPVVLGQPYVLDESEAVERFFVPMPTTVLDQLSHCRRPTVWLIPRGEQPFSDPAFPIQAQTAFLQGFRQIGQTATYDLYGCATPPAQSRQP